MLAEISRRGQQSAMVCSMSKQHLFTSANCCPFTSKPISASVEHAMKRYTVYLVAAT
jgi:hypothetical protein